MSYDTQPRSLRNNNPLNIRKNSDNFLGEIIPSTDPAFKQFTSMMYGYRAGFVVLGTYLKRGVNTIDKIIKSWAPPQDHNNTEGYICSVAARSGVGRFKLLTQNSGNDYIQIVAAMSMVESGIPIVNMQEIVQGFAMQTKIRR